LQRVEQKRWLKPFTWLQRGQIHFDLRFFGPSGLPILPDLLCWWALEGQQYVGTPTASHLRQTRQPVDPGEAPV